MASKHGLLPNNFRFNYQSKFFGIPFFILAILTCFTFLLACITHTYEYTLERPIESIQPDPVLLSLHSSFAQLQNASSLAQTLTDDSNNPQTLRDCKFLLQVAGITLNESIKLLTAGQGDHEVFVAPDIFVVNMFIQASLACQEKCLEGLQKMGSAVFNDVGVRLQRSKQCTSNSSAIFSEIYPLRFRAFSRRTCLFKYICITCHL